MGCNEPFGFHAVFALHIDGGLRRTFSGPWQQHLDKQFIYMLVNRNETFAPKSNLAQLLFAMCKITSITVRTYLTVVKFFTEHSLEILRIQFPQFLLSMCIETFFTMFTLRSFFIAPILPETADMCSGKEPNFLNLLQSFYR